MNQEEQLAEILEQLAAESRAGQVADIESVVRRHPELGAELRSLWATMLLAEDFSLLSEVRLPGDGVHASGQGTAGSAPLPAPFGDFEPLEEIGRGGMGVVYRARQISLSRTVALKMILRGSLASPVDVARFRVEAEAAARISHPNIVQVYEVGEHEGQPFFSMQLIEGRTLGQRLQEGPLTAHEAVAILLPVCRAISEAHRNGILHRDLKPSNILIDHGGRSYVTDFGLAKRLAGTDSDLESLTNSGAILGTPSYMAPEQAAGQKLSISPATDVYSLGAILYAMLTGRPPFQAPSPVDTVLMVLEQDPVLPRVFNPRVDPDLEMVAMKCLQKPVDLRYPDAGALADDLEAWTRHEPVSARSSQFTQVIGRAFRETHHASVLENWGLLWMWHSIVVFVLCLITNAVQWSDRSTGRTSHWTYLGMWCVGLSIWAATFYGLRRRAGPVTFIERQIVHAWAGSMIASMLLYAIEWLLDLPILSLSPVIALVSAMVFLNKACLLNGQFYIQAVVLFVTAILMAAITRSSLPDFSISFYGLISGLCFFVPGLKYHRQRQRQKR